MNKFPKIFFSGLLILFSLTVNASTMSWQDELIRKQTPKKKGNTFPVVTYKAWANHDDGKTLEEKSTTESRRAIFFVVPDTRLENSSHVQQFVNAYADEEHPLRKNQIPTYIVSGANPTVMAQWVKKMGANSDFLRVVPDNEYSLMCKMGVLEKDNVNGLTGKRSLFYVADGKIIELTTEQTYDDIIETSPDKAAQFVERNWQLKPLRVVYLTDHLGKPYSYQDTHITPILKRIDERLLALHNISLVRLHDDFPDGIKYEPQKPHLVLNIFATEIMCIFDDNQVWLNWRSRLNEKFGSNWAYLILLNPVTLGKYGSPSNNRSFRNCCDSLAEHPKEHLFAPVIFESYMDEEFEYAVTAIAQYVERLK